MSVTSGTLRDSCKDRCKESRVKNFLQTSILLFLCIHMAEVDAQSRRIVEYSYDESGNVIQIASEVSDNPPVVSDFFPKRVRVNEQYQIEITGSDLKNATVTLDDNTLQISELTSSENRVTFTLLVPKDSRIGEHSMTLSTLLGDVVMPLEVQVSLPVLFVAPAPIELTNNGGFPVELTLRLSAPDIFPHTLNLSVADSSLVHLSTNTLTIPAGETTPSQSLILTGTGSGITQLNIHSTELVDLSIAVLAGPTTQLPAGANRFVSPALGVKVEEPPALPELQNRGPFLARIGIIKSHTEITNPDINVPSLLSIPLGLVKGRAIQRIEFEQSLVAGVTNVNVSVMGWGLQTIDTVQVIVSEDNALTADAITTTPIVVTENGTRANFQISVAANTPLTLADFVFLQSDTAGEDDESSSGIGAIDPNATRFYFGGGTPAIASISPQVVSRKSTPEFIIRGTHLNEVFRVDIEPADDINISDNLRINEAGTEIALRLNLSEDTPLGERRVTVTSPQGSSSTVLNANNRLLVENAPGKNVNALTAAPVGIVLTPPATEPELMSNTVRNTPIHIVLGSAIELVSPTAAEIGANVQFIVRGYGLANVDEVQFFPEDGIIINDFVVSPDGNSVTVDANIVEQAPLILRNLNLLVQGQPIKSLRAESNRVVVTTRQPAIDSISRNFVLNNNLPQRHIIRGNNFNRVESVTIEPPEGIEVSIDSIAEDGRAIAVNISAAESAITGPRVVIVKTASGQTQSIASPVNTLNIVSELGRSVNAIVAPLLGVELTGTGEPPVEQNISIASPLLGVEIEFTDSTTITENLELTSQPLGVILAASPLTLTPNVAFVDSTVTLNVRETNTAVGSDLASVNDIQILPDEGITVNSFTLSGDSTSLAIDLTVQNNAEATLRQLVLNTAEGPLEFGQAQADRLQIVGSLPVIESVTPIQETPQKVINMIIRGENFTSATDIRVVPEDENILFGPPKVNAQGTEITVNMFTGNNTEPGPKAIVVTTLAGDSTTEQTAETTFTIVVE